ALLAEPSTDRVGLLEVAALAGRVALGDGDLDLGLAESSALEAARAQVVEQRRRLRRHDPDRRADAGQLGPHGAGLGLVAGVEGAIQVAHAVEDEADGLRGVEVVVHGLAEGGLERGRLARQGAVDTGGGQGGAGGLVRAREGLVQALERAARLVEAPRGEVERGAGVRARGEEAYPLRGGAPGGPPGGEAV